MLTVKGLIVRKASVCYKKHISVVCVQKLTITTALKAIENKMIVNMCNMFLAGVLM